MTFDDMSAAIVQTVACIPDFVKLVLFLENDDDGHRDQCLSTTLMRRVLTSKYSVGSWLTGMLLHGKKASDLAIDYLRIVSQASVCVDVAESSSARIRSKQSLREGELRDEFYQEVSRIEGFVPSLLSLGEEQIEEAATTKVVQQVLDRIISRPFAVTVVFCDALFLAFLITGYRGATSGLLLGRPPEEILKRIYVANIGIFYFVIREIGKAISLCMVSRHARVYFLSFWNLTDVLTTILALVSTVLIRARYLTGMRTVCAITTGFMWLRVLSFLKGINMQLATFVLAILQVRLLTNAAFVSFLHACFLQVSFQITRDILWFCVILFIVVVLFSQMFFTLLAPTECMHDESLQESKECNQSEYYLKVYAILLGDFGLFERESFNSVFSLFLVILYTFMVVLVLLNVLIAVASDSVRGLQHP